MKSKQAQLRQAMKLERERKKKIQQQQMQTKPKITGILKAPTHVKPESCQNESKSITIDDGKNGVSGKRNKVSFNAESPQVKVLTASREEPTLPTFKKSEENVSSSKQSIEPIQIVDSDTEKEFEDLLNVEPNVEKEGIDDELINESRKIDSLFEKEKEKEDMKKIDNTEKKLEKNSKNTNKKKGKKRRLLKTNASDLTDVEQAAYEARLARLMLLSKNNVDVTSTVQETNDLPTLAFNEYADDRKNLKDDQKLSSDLRSDTGNPVIKDSSTNTEFNDTKRNSVRNEMNQNHTKAKDGEKKSVLQILQQKRNKARKLANVATDEYDEKHDLYFME